MRTWMPGVIAIAVSTLACASSPSGAPCAPAAASAQPTGDDLAGLTNEQLARKLLSLTGAENLGKQVLDGMAENLRKMPGLAPGFMDRFMANAKPEDLLALIVPIYVKNFDRETLGAAIHFYESKQGRALVAQQPIATKESMDAGRIWGRNLAEKTLAEMGNPTPKAP
jgi:uncharacterized protein